MPGCFADRLGDFIEVTQRERTALDRLEERPRSLKRGAALVRENDAHSELFLLTDGMMMSSVLLRDGSRQILRFYYPGDLLGQTVLAYRESPETIVAQAESVVCPIDKAAMSELFCDHPRLAGLITAMTEIERVTLGDRLAEVGRSSAHARVAALLLGIRQRMRGADRDIGDSFAVGLTQEEMGDATGLTAVHVNRMLRTLQRDGLIARDGNRLTILDEAAMIRTANFVDRLDGIDLSWLPAAR